MPHWSAQITSNCYRFRAKPKNVSLFAISALLSCLLFPGALNTLYLSLLSPSSASLTIAVRAVNFDFFFKFFFTFKINHSREQGWGFPMDLQLPICSSTSSDHFLSFGPPLSTPVSELSVSVSQCSALLLVLLLLFFLVELDFQVQPLNWTSSLASVRSFQTPSFSMTSRGI